MHGHPLQPGAVPAVDHASVGVGAGEIHSRVDPFESTVSGELLAGVEEALEAVRGVAARADGPELDVADPVTRL